MCPFGIYLETMPSRDRVPFSGKSNASSVRSGGGLSARSPAISSRLDTGRTDDTLPTSRKEQLNNPLEVFRPYSPEVTVSDSHIQRPPILPKNRFPTVPPSDKTLGVSKKRSHSICPDGFVEANLAPNWFETLDQAAALLDVESKVERCREFVERNQDKMWRYDLKFTGKTPRTVVNQMMSEEGLLTRMQKFNKIERAMKVSSSMQFQSCYNDNRTSDSKAIIKTDPYLMSYDTSRKERSMKMTNLMTNAAGDGKILQHGTRNQRGYRHTTGFGNFSNFNGLLQLNKNCSLNR